MDKKIYLARFGRNDWAVAEVLVQRETPKSYMVVRKEVRTIHRSEGWASVGVYSDRIPKDGTIYFQVFETEQEALAHVVKGLTVLQGEYERMGEQLEEIQVSAATAWVKVSKDAQQNA